MNNKAWLDKEKLLEIAQSDGEVTLTSEQLELLFEENAKLVKALEWYRDKSDEYVTSYGADPCGISKPARECLKQIGGAR